MRQTLLEELRGRPLSMRDLSVRLSMREREILPHLEHLEQSLRGRGDRLVIEPASCMSCGYVFRERSALGKPSKCPSCRSERIEAPRFSIAERASS